MNANDPNTPALELVAAALGRLREQLVLVGGCSVGLLITDQARPPVRETVDVDLVAEVASTGDFYASLHPALKECGFQESSDSENMCRWKKGALIVDVMPSSGEVFGHSTNSWYPEAVRDPQKTSLPSGLEILVVSAPLFIATKLEAFYGRGKGDYISSHDMEDIINVVDGREELFTEVSKASERVQTFLKEEFRDLLEDEAFTDQLTTHFRPDAASQARVPIVIARLRAIAGI
jgi:predicted nucleotidyltransferase